jgi:AcrR family transcriptional regulator
VGVDLIVERAGVAKTSLYRHFGTKDDLIEAFLLLEDEDFWQHWDAVAAQHKGAPRESWTHSFNGLANVLRVRVIAAARRSTLLRNMRTRTIRRARSRWRTSENCDGGSGSWHMLYASTSRRRSLYG